MKRPTDKTYQCAWASAQAPRLIQGSVLSDRPVSPAEKALESEQLCADVEAYLANGGQVQVIGRHGIEKRKECV